MEVVLSLQLEDRYIRLAKQTKQSINICLPGDPDSYESYLIKPPYVMPTVDLRNEILKFKTISDLIDWLKNERHAVSLGIRQKNNTAAIPCTNYSPINDKKISTIKEEVEKSIDELVKEFIENPYLHRVESSIHTELFYIMKQKPILSQNFFLGDGQTKTQLIHNEWPSVDPIYGNYDFAIMTPEVLQKDCPTTDVFSRGKFKVPIVVELGLNPSDTNHLENDRKKIISNGVYAGYLIHLIRDKTNSTDENIILDESHHKIKTAYVCINNGKIRYKYINDNTITEI
jgi:hypothetical protein